MDWKKQVTDSTDAQTWLQLVTITYYVVLPILILAAIGFLLQRRLGLDMPTLTRLNFHFVIPGMIYYFIVTSELKPGDIGLVVVFELVFVAGLAFLSWAVSAVRNIPVDQRAPAMMTVLFHNSGNYGLPLQQLAFRPMGVEVQANAVSLQVFVLMVQNLLSFTLGVILAARGKGDGSWRRVLRQIAAFPPIYAVLAAFLTRWIRQSLSAEGAERAMAALQPFWDVVVYVNDAFIALAILTLGGQLAIVRRDGPGYPVTTGVVLRLLAGPALGLLIIYAMGMEGLVAQVILISTTTPTSVNAMLLCLQFDNHPDLVAKSVFYSTLFSPITVTLVIWLAQSGLLPGF